MYLISINMYYVICIRHTTSDLLSEPLPELPPLPLLELLLPLPCHCQSFLYNFYVLFKKGLKNPYHLFKHGSSTKQC